MLTYLRDLLDLVRAYLSDLLSSEHGRAVFYRVVAALGAVAVTYGLVTEEQLALVLPLLATVLGVTLAASKTDTKRRARKREKPKPGKHRA